MVFTTDELASLLADAHMNGYQEGYTAMLPPDPETLFMAYSEQVEGLCTARVEH